MDRQSRNHRPPIPFGQYLSIFWVNLVSQTGRNSEEQSNITVFRSKKNENMTKKGPASFRSSGHFGTPNRAKCRGSTGLVEPKTTLTTHDGPRRLQDRPRSRQDPPRPLQALKRHPRLPKDTPRAPKTNKNRPQIPKDMPETMKNSD